MRRIHGTFACPICDKALKTTIGFRSHLVSHGLKMTISDTSLPEPKNSLQDLEDVSDSMSPSEIIHHIPPEDLIIGNSSKSHKKRKLLSHSQTILASSDSITAETQEKTDKLMIAKLGRWVPVIYECESEQHGLLTSIRSATMLLQESSQTGAWKKPAADLDPSIGVPCVKDYCNSDSLIKHIKSTRYDLWFRLKMYRLIFFFLSVKQQSSFPQLFMKNLLLNIQYSQSRLARVSPITILWISNASRSHFS